MLALRTWARYVVPLTLLSAVVHAPLLRYTMALDVPKDAAGAKQLLVVVWIVAATAWIAQLALVAAAAPVARSVAAGAPLSQWKALVHGFGNLVRMVVPVASAV